MDCTNHIANQSRNPTRRPPNLIKAAVKNGRAFTSNTASTAPLSSQPLSLSSNTIKMSVEKREPSYSLPHQARSLRACMVCTIILPQSTFISSGCPNCEEVLLLVGSNESVSECTSSNFNGTLALLAPRSSWVGRWQRLEGYVPGVYAIQVIGTLPEEQLDSIRAAGIRYVPRDGRAEDEGVDMEM